MSSSAEVLSPEPGSARSGFLSDRIVHVHPTRFCNLACLHCYSESEPRHKAALEPVRLCAALGALREEGYRVLSLSGGEPTMYRPLRELIEHARELGFRVTMISNGMLAAGRLDSIASLLDGIAISFDGLAESHNALRGRRDAFERATDSLRELAARGRPVAAAISLTRDAIPELPDLADQLVSLGARALQIRPVARAGRARSLATSTFYSPSDRVRLYLVALALQQELPDTRVSCDLAPTQGLWRQRDAYASLLGGSGEECAGDRPLADLVNPLVITATGVLKPIAYDFDSRFDVASLDTLSSGALRSYKQWQLPRLQALLSAALEGLRERHDMVDWFDHCTRLSETFTCEQ